METTSAKSAAQNSVSALLVHQAANCPDAVFLQTGDRSISYREANEQAHALAQWMVNHGVRRGDRVAICVANRAEIAISIFAASLVGAIFVVLNPRLRAKGVAKILDQAETSVVIADDLTADNIPRDLKAVRLTVADESLPGDIDWQLWRDALSTSVTEKIEWPGIDVDPACLVFTSGSTGMPRGVTLSHDNIRFVVKAIQQRLQYQPTDVIGCFLPLAFDYGLYQILLAAESGAALHIGDPDQVGPRLPRILKAARVTVLPGVPALYAALLKMHQRRPYELPDLRAVTNTGERLPPAYIAEMRQRFAGLEVYVMYGLTECKRVSIMLPHELDNKPTAVGRPLEGTEVYAVDESGERLNNGETGELVVRGRHVALGYWRAPDETAQRFRKRAPESAVELFTGDHGFVDEDGFIYFSARADDLLKHRGNRISPVEIENEACSIVGVSEAAALKREVDDTLHLFVTTSDSALDDAHVLQCLNEVLEPAKVPEFVTIVESLPKSINGKIDRNQIQHQLDEQPELVTTHE